MIKRPFLLAALAALSPVVSAHAGESIDPAELTATVRTMTDDWFQGRAPGTVGEQRTVGYLIGRFQALGLQPGGPDGRWVQEIGTAGTYDGVVVNCGDGTPFYLQRDGSTRKWQLWENLDSPAGLHFMRRLM
jgi:hypothetical protein